MYQLGHQQQEIEALQQRFKSERQQFVHSAETALPRLAQSSLKSGLSLAFRVGIKRIGSNLIQRKERRHTSKRQSKRRIALIATISAAVLVSQLLALKKNANRSES